MFESEESEALICTERERQTDRQRQTDGYAATAGCALHTEDGDDAEQDGDECLHADPDLPPTWPAVLANTVAVARADTDAQRLYAVMFTVVHLDIHNVLTRVLCAETALLHTQSGRPI